MPRGQFNSKLGFILATAGSAVGLGNIWGFPFQVGNGSGAAFVVIYLMFSFVLCFPVMVAEIAIGRATNLNPVGAFRALGHRRWSLVGMLGVLSGFLILSFYNVLAAWSFGYMFEMLRGNFTVGAEFGNFTSNVPLVSLYSLLFVAATAFIVSKGVKKGIERASKIMMPSLVALILLLVAYSFTLPNAAAGLKFYLVPDFSKVNLQVIYGALGQAFFSLSLGMGTLLTYGSYLSKDESIVGSAAFVTFADVGIAFIAGLMMFPFVFSQDLAPNGGSGLIYMALPGVFGSMGPLLGAAVGAGFFFLLSLAALTSTVSLLEVPVAFVVDELKIARPYAVALVSAGVMVVSVPSILANGASEFFTNFTTYFGREAPVSFMTLMIDLANSTFLPLGGCLISIFVAFVWRRHNLNFEIRRGQAAGFAGSFVQKYIDFAIAYLCPVLLGLIFILTILNLFLGVTLF